MSSFSSWSRRWTLQWMKSLATVAPQLSLLFPDYCYVRYWSTVLFCGKQVLLHTPMVPLQSNNPFRVLAKARFAPNRCFLQTTRSVSWNLRMRNHCFSPGLALLVGSFRLCEWRSGACFAPNHRMGFLLLCFLVRSFGTGSTWLLGVFLLRWVGSFGSRFRRGFRKRLGIPTSFSTSHAWLAARRRTSMLLSQ